MPKKQTTMLETAGIEKNKTKRKEVFEIAISENFLEIPHMKSSEYIKYCYDKYEKYCKTNPQDRSTNGNIFELIVITELYRCGIFPMFIQAQVAFVPNVNFDVLLYSSEKFPIGISLKTSLRERYKQADLEAVALKYVHRKAKNYLLTLDEKEAKSTKLKQQKGELLGLDKIIVTTHSEFDEFVAELKETKLVIPEKIEVITAQNIVVR